MVSHVDSADSSKVSCDERGKDFADEPSLKNHFKVEHIQEGSLNVKNQKICEVR